MLVKIEKEFPFAKDGLRTVIVKPGDPDIDVPDHLLVGLMTGGFVSVDGVGVAQVAEIETLSTSDNTQATVTEFNKDTATADELRAYLTTKGISFHHKAGVDKLRALVP